MSIVVVAMETNELLFFNIRLNTTTPCVLWNL